MTLIKQSGGLMLGLLLWVLNPATATATPLTWNLLNVAFDDGGMAQGTFDFDADTGLFSNISVSTAGGSSGQANNYAFATIFANANFPDFVDTLPIVPGITVNLSLALVDSMTNAGGTIAIQGLGSPGLAQESICDDTTCNNLTAFRQIVSGAVTTVPLDVPEPGILATLSLGLAALGLTRRKTHGTS